MDNKTPLFVEIRREAPEPYTDAFTLTPIAPKDCRSLILRLNQELPLPPDSLNHLKRVRKSPDKTISIILYPNIDHSKESLFDQLRKEGYQILLVKVPARLPETLNEWKEFNSVWPTKYILTAPPAIALSEQKVMLCCLQKAQDYGGVIIVDPATEIHQPGIEHDASFSNGTSATAGLPRIVATAKEEGNKQGFPENPLASNFILAIQGVSRIERETFTRLAALPDPSEHHQEQYLCTSYDVYCTKEPSVYESMALLHARIRRLIFAEPISDGGITKHMIHALQLTNHRYRALQLSENGQT